MDIKECIIFVKLKFILKFGRSRILFSRFTFPRIHPNWGGVKGAEDKGQEVNRFTAECSTAVPKSSI